MKKHEIITGRRPSINALSLEEVLEAKKFIASNDANKGIFAQRMLDCKREFAFATYWAYDGLGCPNASYKVGMIQILFTSNKTSAFGAKLPKEFHGKNERITRRDKMIVATMFQWLGSNVGWTFLNAALNAAGYKLTRIEGEDNA